MDLEENVPARSDYYVMALIREVRYLISSRTAPPLTAENLLKHHMIVVTKDKRKAKAVTQDAQVATARSRERWLAGVGSKVVGDPRKRPQPQPKELLGDSGAKSSPNMHKPTGGP